MAGNHRGNPQPLATKQGEVSRRINSMTVQNVEMELAMATQQPPAIPSHQPVHRYESRMPLDAIRKRGIFGGPKRSVARRQHHHLMPLGHELPGQGGDLGFDACAKQPGCAAGGLQTQAQGRGEFDLLVAEVFLELSELAAGR